MGVLTIGVVLGGEVSDEAVPIKVVDGEVEPPAEKTSEEAVAISVKYTAS
jgi:hypothetical protein